MSQRETVLKHLESGRSITQVAAVSLYDIYRLSSVIFDLRQRGHRIVTKMVNVGDKQFARYYIPESMPDVSSQRAPR